MKVISRNWFSTMYSTVGIIVGEDEVTGKRKAYIGECSGFDIVADTELIAKNGAPFDLAIAEGLVEKLKD